MVSLGDGNISLFILLATRPFACNCSLNYALTVIINFFIFNDIPSLAAWYVNLTLYDMLNKAISYFSLNSIVCRI